MQETSTALIEQLVYFDNFMLNSDTPNLDLDGQLSMDLAAFADDSFVFADEDKPDPSNMSDIEGENGRNDMPQGQSRNRPDEQAGHENHGLSERFRNQNAQRNGPHNHDENFPLGLHEGHGSSSNLLEDHWYHSEKAANGQVVNHHDLSANSGAPEGNQLHSILNDKIETTKRNKFQHHVGNSGLSAGSHAQAHEQFEEQNGHGNGHQNGHQNLQNHHENHNIDDHGAHGHSDLHSNLPNDNAEHGIPDLTRLPKYPVPPGAKTSLKKAGLSQNQIDLLSALIAQHQTSIKTEPSGENGTNPPISVVPTLVSHGSSSSHPVTAREVEQYKNAGLTRLERAQNASMIESPASNYSSEHSIGSTMSVTYSPYKENTSSNVSDANPGEDLSKRKRNTAASARFRIKKKMKEKEMEVKISQLGDMIQKFELRIDELEMENRFLKNLVIEKSNRESDEELQLLKDKTNYVDRSEVGKN